MRDSKPATLTNEDLKRNGHVTAAIGKAGLIRQTFKFLTILSVILVYLAHSYLYTLIYRDLWIFRYNVIRLLSRYCRFALKVIGIRVQLHGALSPDDLFFVSNHMSYLDVLIISSQFPSSYVTSVEIRETPVLGLLTQLSGCLYVERRNKANLSQEISDLTLALNHKIPVTVFPEATSTNGESILRFRKPLFQAAIDADVPVSPMALNYGVIDGEIFSKKNRDFVCWYGDMAFLPHLWNLVGCREIVVDLDILNKVSQTLHKDPLLLAEESQIVVTKSFRAAKD